MARTFELTVKFTLSEVDEDDIGELMSLADREPDALINIHEFPGNLESIYDGNIEEIDPEDDWEDEDDVDLDDIWEDEDD